MTSRQERPPEGGSGLQVTALRVLGNGGERPDRRFSRGETVEIRAMVTGLTAPGRRLRLRTSWQLQGPGGRLVLQKGGAAGADQLVPTHRSTEVVETSLLLPLPVAATPGTYKANLRFRDDHTGTAASVEVELHVIGPSASPAPGFSIQRFRPPPDEDLLAGLPMTLDFELGGLASASSTTTGQVWPAKAQGNAQVLDASGRVRLQATRLLANFSSPVPLALVPVRWLIDLPSSLEPGAYELRITVKDLVSGPSAAMTHRFRLLQGSMGLYAVRLSGQGDAPRMELARGERMNVDLLLANLPERAPLELDVGLVGPDDGFYLIRKASHRVPASEASRAPRPVRLSLRIPEFAPAGPWRLKLRLRATSTQQEATREVPFAVTGPPLEPWPSLRVQGLRLRRTLESPPLPLRLLRAGESYHLDFVVGGLRFTREQGYYHRVKLRCTLRLRDRAGRLVTSLERACDVDRRFSFAPLRMRLAARFSMPRQAIGPHRLEVEVLDLQSDRVSSLQRAVFLLIPQ